MFTTERGTAVDPRNALRAINTAAKALGMSGVGLHTLRHSAATHMLAAGVPLHTVSEPLGHSCVAVTRGRARPRRQPGARAPPSSETMDERCRTLSNVAERPWTVALPTIEAQPAAGSKDRGEPERTTPNDGEP